MAEPVNTLTNLFILLAAIMALREVRRAGIGRPPGIAILLALLFATAIGSFAWHGLRTRIALAFDALPGLAFLFVFAGLWTGALWGRLAGWLGALGLLAACVGALYVGRTFLAGVAGLPPAFFLIPAYAAIAIFGTVLFAATRRRHDPAVARLGGIAVVCGIAAAICRSADLPLCRAVPFGTHFLWHILLSLAAYLGIVMLIRLKTPRAGA
jgi:hypothetical protein